MVFTIQTGMRQTLIVSHRFSSLLLVEQRRYLYRSHGQTYASHPSLAGGLSMFNYGANRPALSLFEQLRIEKFRISKDYIKNVPSDFVGDALIKAVTFLARSLGIDTVGEGIENAQQDAFSTSQNSDSGQGNLQAKAMKASEATFYLRCNKRK